MDQKMREAVVLVARLREVTRMALHDAVRAAAFEKGVDADRLWRVFTE